MQINFNDSLVAAHMHKNRAIYVYRQAFDELSFGFILCLNVTLFVR